LYYYPHAFFFQIIYLFAVLPLKLSVSLPFTPRLLSFSPNSLFI
jgi:hypothetical protein